MKYAIVEKERREAEPSLSGECPACGKAMIAKCGQHRIDHWAHQGKPTCDPWWENEQNGIVLGKTTFPKAGKSLSKTESLAKSISPT